MIQIKETMEAHLVQRCFGMVILASLLMLPLEARSSRINPQRIKVEGSLEKLADEGIEPDYLDQTSGDETLNAKIKRLHAAIDKQYGLNTSVVFYDDESIVSSAFATRDPRTSPAPDGAILLGKKFMLGKATDDMVIAVILAHEGAHLLQIKKGSTLSGQPRELHADFLSGWVLARLGPQSISSREKFDMTIKKVVDEYYSHADYTFNSKEHHGTGFERMMAMGRGLELERSDLQAAYQSGVTLFNRLLATASQQTNQAAVQYAEKGYNYYSRNKPDWKKAAAEFEKAARLDPGNAEWHHFLGSSLLNIGGKSKAAEVALRRALEINTNNPDTHWLLSVALARQLKNDQEAQSAIRKAQQLDPYQPEFYNTYGLILASKERWREAEEQFRRAVSMDPSNPDFQKNLKSVQKRIR